MQFILIPIYSYTLTTSQFGRADFITTIISLISPLIYLDITDGVFRFTLDKLEDPKKVFSIGMIFATIVSTFSLIIGLIISPFVPEYPIFGAACLLVATTFFGLISNYVRAIGKIKSFAIAGIINTFVMGIANIIFLVVLHGGVSFYLGSMTLGQVVALIYLFFSVSNLKKIKLKYFDKKLFWTMCLYSVPLIPNSFAWWLNSASDRFFILLMLGAKANGIYAMVNRFPAMVTTLINIFFQSWQMTAVEEYDSKDSKEFISNVFEYIVSLIFLLSLVMMAVLRPMTRVVLDISYFSGWKLLPIMLLVSIYTVIAGFLGILYTASKNTMGVFYSTVLGALINIVLTVILIRCIGIYGAAIANAISFFCVFLYRYMHIQKFHKIKMNVMKFTMLHVLLILSSIINYYVNNDIIVFSLVSICITIQIFFDHRIKIILWNALGLIRNIIK